MKKLLLIPVTVFPYSYVLGLFISELFANEEVAIWVFTSVVAFFFVSPLICNIVYMVLSKNADTGELIRAALIIKLVHIPAYVMIFLFCLVASIMILMTFPLILMLMLFDYIVLLSSGMISVFALAKNIKYNKKLSIIALICQFFFCADVISLFVMHRISKKQAQIPLTIQEQETP